MYNNSSLQHTSLLTVSGFEGPWTKGGWKPFEVQSEQLEMCLAGRDKHRAPSLEKTSSCIRAHVVAQTLLLMDAEPGIWDRYFQSPPRLQGTSSFQGDSSTPSHSSLSLVSCLPLGASPRCHEVTAMRKARLPGELAA